MRTRIFFFILLSVSFGLYALTTLSNQETIKTPFDYVKEWKKADSLKNMRQPRSAMEVAEYIKKQALAENNHPQLVKALMFTNGMYADFGEDTYEKAINETQKLLETSKPPLKQILHSIQAGLFYSFYNQNRWTILQRGKTEGKVSEDIREWDSGILMDTIAAHYLLSLSNQEITRKIPSIEYIPVMDTANLGFKAQPQLFDFLANQAFSFFSNPESAISDSDNGFYLDHPYYFDPIEEFIKIVLPESKKRNYRLIAMKIMQNWLTFKSAQKDLYSLVDTDLQRLNFVNQNSALTYSDSLYKTALKSMLMKTRSHEVSTEIQLILATQYTHSNNVSSDIYQAIYECRDAIKRFPDSRGAKQCKHLLHQLLYPSLQFEIPQVLMPVTDFEIISSYKNISNIHVQTLRVNPSELIAMANTNPEENYQKYSRYRNLHNLQFIPDSINSPLMHRQKISLPGLPEGTYVMILTHRNPSMKSPEVISLLGFQVSNLSAMTSEGTGIPQTLVQNRRSGFPLQGAKVNIYKKKYDQGSRTWKQELYQSYQTNAEGFAQWSSTGGQFWQQYQQLIVYQKDSLWLDNITRRPVERTLADNQHCFIYTDRSIYRPGQTIYFKALLISGKENNYATLKQTGLKIRLNDANGQTVKQLELKTNEYGTLSGKFILPEGSLNGRFTIHSDYGQQGIQVEEYKRPVFSINMFVPDSAARPGDSVLIKGEAKALAGFGIPEALVNFNILRNQIEPYPFLRSYIPSRGESIIFSGVTKTDKNGNFIIRFKASPDKNVKRANVIYRFSIEAGVTDQSGESRSKSLDISIAEKHIQVFVEMNDKTDRSNPGKFKLNIHNLAGKPMQMDGNVEIIRMEEPLKNQVFNESFQAMEEFNRNLYSDWLPSSGPDFSEFIPRGRVWYHNFSLPKDSVLKPAKIQNWEPGVYKMILKVTKNRQVLSENIQYFVLYDGKSNGMPYETPDWVVWPEGIKEAGSEIQLRLGSSFKNTRILLEVLSPDGNIVRTWNTINQAQTLLKIPLKDSLFGQYTLRYIFVKNGRLFTQQNIFMVDDPSKELEFHTEHFKSDILPGSTHEFRFKIKTKNHQISKSEIMACMYDASLDAFMPHGWYFGISKTYPFVSWQNQGNFGIGHSPSLVDYSNDLPGIPEKGYNQYNWHGLGMNAYMYRDLRMSGAMAKSSVQPEMAVMNDEVAGGEIFSQTPKEFPNMDKPLPEIRKNFAETAFFYPHIQADDSGSFEIRFKAPDALTQWKLMLMGHTNNLAYGIKTLDLTSSQPLMIIPNAPRFLRQGDQVTFAARLVNQSNDTLQCVVNTKFRYPDGSDAGMDIRSGNLNEKTLTLLPNATIILEENLRINARPGLLIYTYSATSNNFTDAMESSIAVLPSKVWITNTTPIYVNPLSESIITPIIEDRWLQDQNTRITFEFTSNPAWYAVQALPFLKNPEYQCADAIFRAYYANSLARFIAQANPSIQNVIASWKSEPNGLSSELNKNEDLKQILIEESPWIADAINETEQRQNLSELFNHNRIEKDLDEQIKLLSKLQLSNGGFTWFEGMPDSRFITQNIITGFSRLIERNIIQVEQHQELQKMIQQALAYLDERLQEDYERKIPSDYKNILTGIHIQYLYSRGKLSTLFPISLKHDEAVEHYYTLAQKKWKEQDNYSQAMIAIALWEHSEEKPARQIIKSLHERSLSTIESGMYWREPARAYRNAFAVQSQAIAIEAFHKILKNEVITNSLKKWLLKQKQTRMWENAPSTADAVYALLGENTRMLETGKNIKISTTGVPLIVPQNPQAGSGYFRQSFHDAAKIQEFRNIRVQNPDSGIAWGAVYLQYFEEMDKVSSHMGGLELKRELYIEKIIENQKSLIPVDLAGKLYKGDKLIVRLILSSDRSIDYVHLRDFRSVLTEPKDVISGYQWKGGVGYYQISKDASTDFFFETLPKGLFVIEYEAHIMATGNCNAGYATVQSLYSPGFSARSESRKIRVE